MNLQKYNKTIVAVLIGLLQIASVYFMGASDGDISPTDIQAIINAAILALGGAGAVYAVKNQGGK